MIDKAIVIAALARDCNRALRANIPRVERLRSYFAHSRVVVVENDSKDGTKETLKDWAARCDGVELIMHDFGSVTIPTASAKNPYPSTSLFRIEKMARYRNMYMEYVRNLEVQPDYLVLLDLDVVSFSVEGIVQAIGTAPEGWGALFANGRRYFHHLFPYYFDLYAYLPMGCEVYDRKNDELFYESKRITRMVRHQEFVPCLSAFGGIGVYRWEAVRALSYQALPNTRSRIFEAVCEHVPFNLSVTKQGYGCYVCRRMYVNYGTRSWRHLFIYSLLPTRWYQWLYKRIKGVEYGD